MKVTITRINKTPNPNFFWGRAGTTIDKLVTQTFLSDISYCLQHLFANLWYLIGDLFTFLDEGLRSLGNSRYKDVGFLRVTFLSVGWLGFYQSGDLRIIDKHKTRFVLLQMYVVHACVCNTFF